MPDLILKADSYDKQSAAWRKANTLSGLRRTHYLMPKYDGCHCIIRTTTCEVMSREGKPIYSMDAQAHAAWAMFGPGFVLQGEAWKPHTPFPEISGEFRRHAHSGLKFIAYNVLTDSEFDDGMSPRPYSERFEYLDAGIPFGHPLIDIADVLAGDPMQLAERYKAQLGYDGIIAAAYDGLWQRGRSRNGELVKIKPVLSLDLFVTDRRCEPGAKTGRPVWTVAVEYRGVTTWVGSGIPHDEAAVPKVGDLIEVEAMDLTDDGALREPRFKAIRYDKEEPDT